MDLLTTRQVADQLELDISTVSRWVTLGKITPAVRLPSGQMLFAPAEVDRLAREWATNARGQARSRSARRHDNGKVAEG
jgi:predicted site-specific integrase-resolvase